MRFKRPRVTAPAHLKFIASLPCVICNNDGTDAAHIRAGKRLYGKRETGLGEKPSDCWTVPLCREHHSEQHGTNELKWWESKNINPFTLAMSLFVNTGNYMAALDSIGAHRGNNKGKTA